ncbi:MAG: hypothetical protein FRX49_05686 [Trebouxia sp. A1-2]|nr:MAG: hypothetical protein FRX49_05686 [Trebouxia sp. A1-2]
MDLFETFQYSITGKECIGGCMAADLRIDQWVAGSTAIAGTYPQQPGSLSSPHSTQPASAPGSERPALLALRKAGRLGRQLAPTREAKHVLKLCVPGNAVGILVLGEQGLALHAVNLHRVVVIHHCQLPTAAAQIQAPAGLKKTLKRISTVNMSLAALPTPPTPGQHGGYLNSSSSMLTILPESISVVVEPMHSGEQQLIHSNAAIFAAHSHKVLLWMTRHTPDPATTSGKR